MPLGISGLFFTWCLARTLSIRFADRNKACLIVLITLTCLWLLLPAIGLALENMSRGKDGVGIFIASAAGSFLVNFSPIFNAVLNLDNPVRSVAFAPLTSALIQLIAGLGLLVPFIWRKNRACFKIQYSWHNQP